MWWKREKRRREGAERGGGDREEVEGKEERGSLSHPLCVLSRLRNCRFPKAPLPGGAVAAVVVVVISLHGTEKTRSLLQER